MKKSINYTKLITTIFGCIVSIFILTSCSYSAVNVDEVYEALEKAYFEGQKDALSGDIRIKRNIDSCWIWTKSPWDKGTSPIFDPSFDCE